jgi:hypothetical protein
VRRIITLVVFVSSIAAPAFGGSLDRSVFANALFETPSFELEGDGGGEASLRSAAFAQEYAQPPRSAIREASWSLIIPGLAQQRLGHRTRSRIYYAVEGLTWLAIGGFLWQGYSEENSYREYAVAYAGVSDTDHSDDYYEIIGQYISNDGPGGYNEAVLREARDLYYPDLDAMEQYYASNSITGSESWLWQTERSLGLYADLRDSSRTAYRRALYAAVFAVAMRMVSTIDAVRLARADIDAESRGLSLGVEPIRDGMGIFVGGSF